ncbi:MAG: hypothetical protein WAN86_21830 [Hyphomicrobiaceae bacterium]
MRSLKSTFALAALIVMAIGAVVGPTLLAAPALEPRKSDEAGVQVVVTPKPFDPAAATLDFDVVMDTHTKPLSDDLVRASELIVDGSSYSPTGWQGDPPGGHHRKGVLKFPRPIETPKRIEMRINGIAGAGVRTFTWE